MDNYNPLLIENKWQKFFEEKKIFNTKKTKKNFTALKCFLIHQEIFIWGM